MEKNAKREPLQFTGLNHGSTLACARALDRDGALAQALALSLVEEDVRALDRAFVRGLNYSLDFKLAQAASLIRDVEADFVQMSRIIDLMMDRKLEVFEASGKKTSDGFAFLCLFANTYLASFLIRACSLEAMEHWSPEQRKKHGIHHISFDADQLADTVRIYEGALQQVQELYRRITGESEPFEGIRIVRERKKKGTTAEAAEQLITPIQAIRE